MNKKQIEVYNHYKKLYPEALLLFHLEGEYIAMLDDACRAASSLEFHVDDSGTLSIPDNDIGLISELGADGTEVKMIDYRNDDGKRDFPDIDRLKREKDEDY